MIILLINYVKWTWAEHIMRKTDKWKITRARVKETTFTADREREEISEEMKPNLNWNRREHINIRQKENTSEVAKVEPKYEDWNRSFAGTGRSALTWPYRQTQVEGQYQTLYWLTQQQTEDNRNPAVLHGGSKRVQNSGSVWSSAVLYTIEDDAHNL